MLTHGIRKIALAGHPEGSPDMSDEAIRSALKWKNEFSNKTDAEMYLVTQFAFESEPVIAWDQMLQKEGNRLPIHIGIPGLATLKTLLMHAKACGIGASMKFLTRQARNVTPPKRTQPGEFDQSGSAAADPPRPAISRPISALSWSATQS